jgi:putative peptidoglycan lipid II flippase
VSLFKAASTVSLLTLASRVTGLVRDLLMASMFGASALTDAFNVAFPHSQPVSPPVCRGRFQPGVCAGAGRHQGQARRGATRR